MFQKSGPSTEPANEPHTRLFFYSMNSRLLLALFIGFIVALLSRLGVFRRGTLCSVENERSSYVDIRLEDLCPPPPEPKLPECTNQCDCDLLPPIEGLDTPITTGEGPKETWDSLLAKSQLAGSPANSAQRQTERRKKFEAIYASKHWGDSASRSGPGSTLPYTTNVRRLLSAAWRTLNITKFLDAPCGDCNWLPRTQGFYDVSYTGVDIVAHGIIANARRHRHESNMRFLPLDLVSDELPKGQQMVLCRDALQHLPLEDGVAMIRNFERSKAEYLVTNWHFLSKGNEDVDVGGWFMVDVMRPPFNFSKPLFYTVDGPDSTDEKGETNFKLIGLWKLPVLGRGNGERFDVLSLKKAMEDIIVIDPSIKLKETNFEPPDWLPSDSDDAKPKQLKPGAEVVGNVKQQKPRKIGIEVQADGVEGERLSEDRGVSAGLEAAEKTMPKKKQVGVVEFEPAA